MIREKFDFVWLSNFFGNLLKKLPFSPNFYTVLSGFVGLIALYFAYIGNIDMTILFFILTGVLDVADGGVAKILKKTSAKGAFLDGVVVSRGVLDSAPRARVLPRT